MIGYQFRFDLKETSLVVELNAANLPKNLKIPEASFVIDSSCGKLDIRSDLFKTCSAEEQETTKENIANEVLNELVFWINGCTDCLNMRQAKKLLYCIKHPEHPEWECTDVFFIKK